MFRKFFISFLLTFGEEIYRDKGDEGDKKMKKKTFSLHPLYPLHPC